MPKQITIEMANEYPGRDGFYYADLDLPAADYEIRDVLQRERNVRQTDGFFEISVLNCELLPSLARARLDSPTLDELNFFAKRLESLNEEERIVFKAVRTLIATDDAEDELVSMKDLINCTYGLDEVMVASSVRTDEQLGQLVIENELNEDIQSILDNALYLLDRKQIGKLQRENDGGVFIDGFYVAAGDYEMPEVYDGKTLPSEEPPTVWSAFRLKIAEAPVNSADETTDSAKWLSLPTGKAQANTMAKAYNKDCIEDCVYIGFESSIPQITEKMFGDMKNFDALNTLAHRMAEMSPNEQVTFKAALTVEQPNKVVDAVDIAMHLNEYELSYYSDSAAAFYKDYLRRFMDSRFDGAWLDTLTTQNEGERLLKRLGAAETPYGVKSSRGHSL